MALIDTVMQLVQTSIVRNVDAGGPGSGRHPGRGLSDDEHPPEHKRAPGIKKSGLIYETVHNGHTISVSKHRGYKGPSYSVSVTKEGKEVGKTGAVLMKDALADAFKIAEGIKAGGPGSGCQGPTCGRPAGQGVPANRVKTTFISPAGFTYTMLKAPVSGRPKGSRDSKPRVYEARLKGQFKQTLGLQKRQQKRVTTVHDAEKQMYKTPGGTTVVVHRNYGKGTVTVHEMRRGEYGHLERTDIFKFRNAGRAAGFLNKRFGIRLKLPK